MGSALHAGSAHVFADDRRQQAAAAIFGHVAAIHRDAGSSDPVGGVGGKEDGKALDVVGPPEAAARDAVEERLLPTWQR